VLVRTLLRLVQPNQQQGRQNEVFNEMLRGYATMLLAAGRDRGSVGKLLQILRGLVVWADAWPWEWTAQDVDASLLSVVRASLVASDVTRCWLRAVGRVHGVAGRAPPSTAMSFVRCA
jgi:hypothetical protein